MDDYPRGFRKDVDSPAKLNPSTLRRRPRAPGERDRVASRFRKPRQGRLLSLACGCRRGTRPTPVRQPLAPIAERAPRSAAVVFGEVRGPSNLRKFSSWEVRGPSNLRKFSSWEVRGPSDVRKFSSWEVRGPSNVRKFSSWEVRGPSNVRKFLSWEVRGPSMLRKFSSWEVRGPSNVRKFSSW